MCWFSFTNSLFSADSTLWILPLGFVLNVLVNGVNIGIFALGFRSNKHRGEMGCQIGRHGCFYLFVLSVFTNAYMKKT